jgi:hypothetical protein
MEEEWQQQIHFGDDNKKDKDNGNGYRGFGLEMEKRRS